MHMEGSMKNKLLHNCSPQQLLMVYPMMMSAAQHNTSSDRRMMTNEMKRSSVSGNGRT